MTFLAPLCMFVVSYLFNVSASRVIVKKIEQFHAVTTPLVFISLIPSSPHVVTAPSGPRPGPGPLAVEVSRSHSDTSYSVGLLWTSDHPGAETSTCQHTTLATAVFHAVGGIRTLNPSKLAAVDPHFTLLCHWDIL